MTLLVQQPDQELGGGVGRDEVDADEQALAAHLGDQVRAVGRDGVGGEVADLRAKFTRALDEAFRLDGADGRGDRGGRERAARERRGVQQRVGVERREQLRGRDDAADGHHAAAEDLAREQRVRRDAGEVSAPPGAESAHAGLDLVEDHHGASLGARLPDLPQVAVGRQPDTTLGLDGLEQHHRLGGEHGPERGGVAERDEVDHRQQWAERVAVLRPSGHRQRAQRLAVEPAVHGDHVTLAGQPRQLQPEFGRLGSRVRQEDVVQAGRRDAGQVRGRLSQLRVEEQPGGHGVTLQLLAYRRDDDRVAVAEQEDPEAPAVKVRVPVAAPHLRSGGGHLDRRRDEPRQAGERGVHVLGVAIEDQIAVGRRGHVRPPVRSRPGRSRSAPPSTAGCSAAIRAGRAAACAPSATSWSRLLGLVWPDCR